MDMDMIKAEIELILDKFVAFLDELVNTLLGDVKIELFK